MVEREGSPYGGLMAEEDVDAAEPDVMDLFDTDADRGIVCRVCGSLVAAGGATGPRQPGIEAALARNILTTDDGRDHPMLAGRPPVWTAPAMHSSVVTTLPPGARVLALNADTPVEAAEIRHGNGVFWGVQYHPEITLAEVAASLRRQASDLVDAGLAASIKAVEDHADRLQALSDDPARTDLAWQLGVDDQVTDTANRMREIGNFLSALEGDALRLPHGR